MILNILSIIFVESFLLSSQDDLDKASTEQYKAHLIADEFRRTINDLHNMLQNYVTFNNEIYSKNYNDIKLIFSGNKTRPDNYNEIYRSLPADFGFDELNLDPNKSLLFHIKNSDIDANNLSILLNATDDYNALIRMQERILTTVPIDRKIALELLNSEDYKTQTAKVLNPVINFVSILEQTNQNIINEINQKQDLYESIQKFLILLTVLFIVTVIHLVNKYVVNPITHISQKLESISEEKQQNSKKNIKELVGLTDEMIEELKNKTHQQKISEEKNKKLENSLLDAQRISHVGNWEHNIIKNTLYWSDEFFRICGLKPQSFTPDLAQFIKIIHPDDYPSVTKLFETTISERKTEISVRYRIIRPTGEIRHIKVQGEAIYDQDNTPILMQGVFQDVTDQVLREKEAEKLQNRLIEAQRIGGLGHWNWNIENNKVFWSNHVYKIYGFKEKEVEPSYENFRKILHPDDAAHLDTTTEKALIDGKPFQVEHRLILSSGEIRNVIQRAEVILSKEGKAQQVNGTVQDITDIKKAEELAREAEINLVKIFDVAPAAIITTNHKMEINIFNQSAVKIFGYDQNEVIGHHINMLIPHEYRENHHKKVDEFNKSGAQSRYMNERTGISGLRKDGSIFPAAASVSHTGKGKNKIYTIILLDTTERMRIEEERVQALSEAQEANQAKSQFLATMSHELRTPLNAIIGFSEMMTNKIFGDLGSSRYEEYAEDIVGSSQHLLNLVNDILDLSEIESGKKKMDINHISIHETIDECRFIIDKLAEDKNIDTKFNIPDDITSIYADQRSLKQIIINIMNNALKYTQPEGIVIFDTCIKDNKHIITIEDNGEGIPASKINDVLNPFSRVENDPYKAQEGQGLGLAIVKSLMALHNGKIEIESEYGKGTKVILQFPCKKAS